MQAFDSSSEKKALGMPKLTAQSLQYGRDEMPFLAFGGTEKPRDYVREYMHAEGHKKDWNPANTYGNLGKGEYTAKYGLIWDGETEIYDKHNREARNQMMHMTMSPHEKMQGNVGATIEKEGRIECTPGYVLQNGICVLQPSVSVCQPGWRKENGVCVKATREFMQAQGSFGTAEVNEKYPMTKDSVLSLKRLRSYIQEKNEGTPTVEPTSLFNNGIGLAVVALFLFVLMAMGMRSMKRQN